METSSNRGTEKRILFLLSAGYNSRIGKAYLKLLDSRLGKIVLWDDRTGHQPYCYVWESPSQLKEDERLARAGAIGFVEEEKFDLLRDMPVKVTKIVASDPLAVGGRRGSIRELVEAWEANIPYHISYMYDRGLVPGMPYTVEGDKLEIVTADTQKVEDIVEEFFKGEDDAGKKEIREWLLLLEAVQPELRHVSIDIEVLSPKTTRVPSPTKAEDPIISVAAVGSDGLARVLMLKREGWDEDLPGETFEVQAFEDEKNLILETFRIIESYPLAVTFNGDDFDFPYLRNRAEKLRVAREQIPILIGRGGTTLKRGVHLDLYRLFFNKSMQVYAFGNAYRENTLDAVARSLIGRGKVEVNKQVSEMTQRELAAYNFVDAHLVHTLLSFNDSLVLRLLIVLSRVSRLTIEDVCRQGVSGWIKNLLYYEHRGRGYLIPRSGDILELKDVISTKAVIEGKKYRGAIVVQPIPGIHFDVTVLDFASLYPSALKEWNLSYETVRCPHTECRNNNVPETSHWVCEKRKGLQSLLVGSLRDIRVKWYKPKSNDNSIPPSVRNWYGVIQRALKVFLNASYGVFGASIFPLFCPPVAESTAAIGRYAFTKAIEKAEDLGIKVIYGDTDSIFLKADDPKLVRQVVDWAADVLDLDLDVEKTYRYVVFSTRKKNYLGVTTDNVVDVKGLTGKKRHIPPFMKQAFSDMLDELKEVRTPEDFNVAKKSVEGAIKTWYRKLRKREFELQDLSFHVMLSRSPNRYVKTTPQHVKAARKLVAQGVSVAAGDIISFVKTKGEDGVEPLQFARKEDVDVDKYVEYLESTFEQVLDALEISFNSIIGVSSLEEFLG